MSVLDHWHPILPSRSLRAAPVGIRLAGQEFVLFRDGTGKIGALHDVCPHRRMRLSLGQVCGQRLRCIYHGWTFDTEGCGESPGTPKLQATAPSLETCEAHGAVWVRARGSTHELPAFDRDGHYPAGVFQHRIHAPLELVLDNFTEMEHTPTTHGVFGYPLDRMHEVQVHYEPTDTAVRVTNTGPSKRFPLPLALVMGINREYQFHDNWTTYFSPVHNVTDHYWRHPITGHEARVRLRLMIFFIPVDVQETLVFTFAFVKARFPFPHGGVPLFSWLVGWMLDGEIRRDVRMLEGLASQDTSVQGLKLSRFDRTLGLNRERLARVYRGETATPSIP